MDVSFKLTDFKVYNRAIEQESDGEECKPKKDCARFVVQMFGLNKDGETASILVEDFPPFFYVMVGDNWGQTKKNAFFEHIKQRIGSYYSDGIVDCKLIERKKLDMFDAGKKHRYIEFKFSNVNVFNKVKNLWYEDTIGEEGEKERRLIEKGYQFTHGTSVTYTKIYESNIPPLLRFFHVKEISPSGWIALPLNKVTQYTGSNKQTSCTYEYNSPYKSIIPLTFKDDPVPYNKCSFDIEANSSHGDFPVPIKTYKKLATEMVDYLADVENITRQSCIPILINMISAAFGFSEMKNISIVYPKEPIKNNEDLNERIKRWLGTKVRDLSNTKDDSRIVEMLFENMAKNAKEMEKEITEPDINDDDKEGDEDEDDDKEGDEDKDGDDKIQQEPVQEEFGPSNVEKMVAQIEKELSVTYKNKDSTIVDILCDKNFERTGKINETIRTLRNHFPPLEGDKITFIGSTFKRYGAASPHLEHCIVLNSCDKEFNKNVVIETYDNERDVLLAWTRLIQRENPDIMLGYNIFSFDYEFMFRRSQELYCTEDFLKLSRNIDEVCASTEYKNPGKLDIERSSTSLASGTFELAIINMPGRLQVDMLNWFRRTVSLISYKLDYVAGYFIGDTVKSIEHINREEGNVTRMYTNNMTGLSTHNYVHFEVIDHSSNLYKGGQKFKVIDINKKEKWFEIEGTETPTAKTIKWGLAKDDVTHKDIFRMSNEGPESRAIVAKYCIQDCNLVQHLFDKVDVLTDLVEMSRLCSVPMSFLVFRGQGIKLTSYVFKKCREKGVLANVINKGCKDDAYEGAIVLEPKCGLYLKDPVPVGDFASLYPSAMLSENLCLSSLVWCKIFDLSHNLIKEEGEKDENGNFIYDNLPGYEYVSIPFDTYRWVSTTSGTATKRSKRVVKVKSGYKICRFVQPRVIDGVEERAVLPSILQELLKARKDTRALIPNTQDEFMKNILEMRQLKIKETANSLYGQCGAKTSTFYAPNIAAATTATGRLMLTFAKRVIEECYKDTDIETKYGLMNVTADYVYGDSVASYTPVYIKVNNEIEIITIDELAEKYGNNNWVKSIQKGKQDKEFCELEGVETWTEKGWTKLFRVIRHELASHKKMLRVLTHTGCVDVTDDHSLIRTDGTEVSPNECSVGTELLHCPLTELCHHNYEECNTKHFENMIDASIYTNYLNNKNVEFRLSSSDDMSIIVIPEHMLLGYKNTNSIKKMHEISYQGYVYDLTTENHHFAAGVGNMIVHNTDSVFFKFKLIDNSTGKEVTSDKVLELSIEIAQEACHTVSKMLKQPHEFEYEKTFYPLCLLSKKRYSTITYTYDPTKGKKCQMGNVLKRRDNSPIVKDVYGGVVDILTKEMNIQKAIDFVDKCLQDLVDGKVPIEKLVVTKSLRGYYKNPKGVAHKVLADRIGEREPGNKPGPGDRVPFVFIVTKPAAKGEKILQGDKIETPSYIKDHNIQIDYAYYITNQIMKPLLQLFGLVLTDIWMSQKPPRKAKVTRFNEEVDNIRKTTEDSKKCEKKINKLKDKEVEELLFSKYLRTSNNARNGNQSISKFFKK